MATVILFSKYFNGYKLISLITSVMRMKKLNWKMKNLFLIGMLVSKVEPVIQTVVKTNKALLLFL